MSLRPGVVGAVAALTGAGLAHRLQEKREERNDRRQVYSVLLYRLSHLTLMERDDVPAIRRGKFLRDQRRDMIEALSDAQVVCSKEVFRELSKVADAMDSLDPERDGLKKWQDEVAKTGHR